MAGESRSSLLLVTLNLNQGRVEPNQLGWSVSFSSRLRLEASTITSEEEAEGTRSMSGSNAEAAAGRPAGREERLNNAPSFCLTQMLSSRATGLPNNGVQLRRRKQLIFFSVAPSPCRRSPTFVAMFASRQSVNADCS